MLFSIKRACIDSIVSILREFSLNYLVNSLNDSFHYYIVYLFFILYIGSCLFIYHLGGMMSKHLYHCVIFQKVPKLSFEFFFGPHQHGTNYLCVSSSSSFFVRQNFSGNKNSIEFAQKYFQEVLLNVLIGLLLKFGPMCKIEIQRNSSSYVWILPSQNSIESGFGEFAHQKSFI